MVIQCFQQTESEGKIMELKNLVLFNTLDGLVDKLSEEQIQSNKELAEYVFQRDAIESGNVPESAYEEYDSEEKLLNLIEIVKGL